MSDKINPPIVTDGSGDIGGRLQPPRPPRTATTIGGADSGSTGSGSAIVESTGGASDAGGGGGGGNGFTERLMLLGGWGLVLGANTPSDVRDQMVEFGHIVITPTRLDPRFYTDATILSVSRYTGVLLSVNNQGDKQPMDLQGAGLEWHLGDADGKGFVYETARIYSGDTFAEVINSTIGPIGLLRDDSGNTTAIEPGTIHSVPGTYSGTHIYQNQRTAIRYVCDLFDAEYRINPDGTMDAGQVDDLYVTDPEAVIVRRGAGGDPNVKSLAVSQLAVEKDARDLSTRVVVLAEGEGDAINVGAASLIVNPYKDLHGNTLVRTKVVTEAETEAANASQRASIHLNDNDEIAKRLTLTAEDYDVEGTFNVGDTIWVYDPDSGLVDASNSVRFRGHEINPVSIRVVGISTPIRKGMGVFYRDADGNYTDLTDWVVWQSGPVTVEVGDFPRTLVPHELDAIISGRVNTNPSGDDGSIPGVPAHINTPWSTGNYLDNQGITRSWVLVEWDEPLNTDASTITDGSHYEIRWRTSGQSSYQYATTGWGTEQYLIQDLSPGVGYEISVQAVDIFGNQSGYGADESVTASADVTPPSTPAAATVAGNALHIQVMHELGKSTGGTYNLEADIAHLNVYADTVIGFAPSNANLLGRMTATVANLSLNIPAIGTFEMPDTTPRFIKVTAVDLTGNESAPSTAAAVTAELIDSQHITDLAVTTAKINDLAVTTAKIADLSVTNAKIDDLAVTNAKILSLSASKITAGTISAQEIILSNSTSSILRSSNFSAGSAGWRIRGNGDAEFNNVTIRGTIFASSGSLGNLSVTGDITLDGSGVVQTNASGARVALEQSSGTAGALMLYNSSGNVVGLLSGASGNAVIGDGTGDFSYILNKITPAHQFIVPSGLGNALALQIDATATSVTLGQLIIPSGSAAAPGLAFSADSDSGFYRVGANNLRIGTGGAQRLGINSSGILVAGSVLSLNDTDTGFNFGGVDNGQITVSAQGGVTTLFGVSGLHCGWNGGATSGSGLFIWDLFTDIGNHETLRANRGAGTTTTEVGYFSSWEFDRLTGDRRKDDIVALTESPRWDRDWFYQITPIDFLRLSTGEREFGFNLNQWTKINDNMKYLTTKGDEWGYGPHEVAVLAAMTVEVQDHEKRLRAIESALGIL